MYCIRRANKKCCIHYCTSTFVEIIFMQCVNRLHKNRQKNKSIMRVGKEVLRRRRAVPMKMLSRRRSLGAVAARANAFTLRKQRRRHRYVVDIASQRPVTYVYMFKLDSTAAPAVVVSVGSLRDVVYPISVRARARFDSND